MIDITKIPLDELLVDRAESMQDINVCRLALEIGVTTSIYGEPVSEHLKATEKVVAKIDAELERRRCVMVQH